MILPLLAGGLIIVAGISCYIKILINTVRSRNPAILPSQVVGFGIAKYMSM